MFPINQETLDFATKYGKDNGHKQMFVTDKDETFTSHNLAMNSVGHDEKRVHTVNIEPEVTGDNSGLLGELLDHYAKAKEAGLTGTGDQTSGAGAGLQTTDTSKSETSSALGGQPNTNGTDGEGTQAQTTSALADLKQGKGKKA